MKRARKKLVMSYFTIYGTCDTYEDSSYERDITDDAGNAGKEIIPQVTISLAVPGNRDLVRVSFGADTMPKRDVAMKWEDSGSQLLKVVADIMTVKGGYKNKRAWALASFHGMSISEASEAESKQLAAERKAAKLVAKQRRQEARNRKSNNAKVA